MKSEGVKMRYVLEGECWRFIKGASDRLWKENRRRERKTGCVILRRACSYEIGSYRRQGGAESCEEAARVAKG